jgi:hypothetical protein
MSLVAQVLQRREQERRDFLRRSVREICSSPENWDASHHSSNKHIPEHDGATETAEESISAADSAWRQRPGFRPEGL